MDAPSEVGGTESVLTALDGSQPISDDGSLVGFVNVAWDGGDHAFLLDTRVRADLQRRRIRTELVRRAVLHAQHAACEWMHVDFEMGLAPFYLEACGFRSTPAGLIHLPELPDDT